MPALLLRVREWAVAAARAVRGDGDGLPSGSAGDFLVSPPRRGLVARMRLVSGARTPVPADDVALFCVLVVVCALLQLGARYACMRIDARVAVAPAHTCALAAMPRWRLHQVPTADHVRVRLSTALLHALDADGPRRRSCWSATWLCEQWAAVAFRSRDGDVPHVLFGVDVTQYIGERSPMIADELSRRVAMVAPAVRIRGDDGVEHVLDGDVAVCVQLALDQMPHVQ